MTASILTLSEARTSQRIEAALTALTECIKDEAIPADVRKELTFAHKALHACRSAEVVARMERAQHIDGGDAA